MNFLHSRQNFSKTDFIRQLLLTTSAPTGGDTSTTGAVIAAPSTMLGRQSIANAAPTLSLKKMTFYFKLVVNSSYIYVMISCVVGLHNVVRVIIHNVIM